MASKIFPDPSSSFVYTAPLVIDGAVLGKPGATATVYSDAAGTTEASIFTYPGNVAISGSTLTVDANSLLPLFYGPTDDPDTLYVKVGSGPVTAVYARVDDRLDGMLPRADAIVGVSGTSLVSREIIDPNRTASKWREVFDTATFQSQPDPVYFFGWNADKASGGGDAAEPAIYMGFEADYYDGPSTRVMEWYVGVVRADTSGPQFRPFMFSAARDGNSDLTASVQIDMGDNSGTGPDRSEFAIKAGARQVAKWLPDLAILNTGVQIAPPAGESADLKLVAPDATRKASLMWQDAGAIKWNLTKTFGAANLLLRDEANNRVLAQFFPGASAATSLVQFSAPVAVGSSTTASRPNAGDVFAGTMWYDTTIGKPIFSTGAAWTLADGTAA